MVWTARGIAALGMVLLATGCATPAPAPTAAPFSAQAFAWSSERGRGRIDGRLAYARGGTTYSCQAAGVVLTPETAWVRERMQTLYGSTERAAAPVAAVRSRMTENSPNYDGFVRRSPCDAQSRFSFTGLPDGAWYVITSGMPTPAGGQMAFMQRVVIRGGSAVQVEL